MAEARSRDLWGHTSAVLAMVANCNRDPRRSRVFKPADFNPHVARKKSGIPVTAANIDILRQIFVSAGGAGATR